MLATGLLTLYQLTGTGRWLDDATALIDLALRRFADPDRPGRWFRHRRRRRAVDGPPCRPGRRRHPRGHRLSPRRC